MERIPEKAKDVPIEALSETDNTYRLLVENVNDGIVISQHEHFIYFNARFSEMLGYGSDELHQKTYRDIYTPKGLETLLARGARRDAGEEVSSRYETEFRRRDGTIVPVEANVTIIDYKGDVATFAVVRDMTEQKRLEREREIFSRLGLQLAGTEDIEQVGGIVREVTEQLFDWDALYFAFRRSGRTRFISILRVDNIDGERTVLPPTEWALTPESFMSRLKVATPMLVNRTTDDSGPEKLKLFVNTSRRSASMVFAPMHRLEAFIGVISVQSYTPHKFCTADSDLLQRIADALCPTLERLLAERRTRAFSNLGHQLASVTTPEEAGRIIVKVADELAGWDAAFLDLYHPTTDRIESVINIDQVNGTRLDVPPAYTDAPPRTIHRHIAEHGTLLLNRNSDTIEKFNLAPFGSIERPSETMIFAPVRGKDGVIGFLSIQSYTANAYDRSDVDIVEALGNHCSGALERTRAESQLRKSEQRYRSVVETVETIIIGISVDGRIFEWNRQARMVFGHRRNDIFGRPCPEGLLPPELLDGVGQGSGDGTDSRPSSRITDYESTILLPDGSRRTILWSSTRMYDEFRNLLGVIACGQDVTDRKKWEEELRRSEAHYRAVVEDQTELICRFLPNGKLTFVNEAFCQYFKKSRETIVGTNRLHYVSLADREPARREWESLTPEKPHHISEHRVLMPDGSVRWLEWTNRVVLNSSGEVELYQATGRDVTLLREAQEALKKSRERYVRLLDSSADVFFQIGLDGAVLYANPACKEVFGYAPREFREDRTLLPRLVHPDSREKFNADWTAYRETGRFPQESTPISWQRKDGRVVHTENRFSHLYDDEGIATGILATCRDVTERVRLDKERRELDAQIQESQRLESISLLAGGIAHDFNNLLTGILGNASLALLEVPQESATSESLQHIQTAARRAADLTKQMLAYAGKGKFVVQPVNLSSVVKEMAGLLRTVISKRADLKLELVDDLRSVLADPTQIRQVVMNLITNASDALESKPGRITVRTAVRRIDSSFYCPGMIGGPLEEGGYVVLEVSDNGCGMDEETRARMFDPFFTRKPTGLVGGRGLGLAAVLGIVRNHKGAIEVASEVGNGATFTIYLPVGVGRAEETAVRRPFSSHKKGRASLGTVLIADDEDIVRIVAKGTLERGGFKVVEARDGIEAVETFEKFNNDISAVLLDLKMPRMDGEVALRLIRDIRRDVPVLLMSAFTEQEVTDIMAGNAYTAFVQKPFSPQELFERVSQLAPQTTPLP